MTMKFPGEKPEDTNHDPRGADASRALKSLIGAMLTAVVGTVLIVLNIGSFYLGGLLIFGSILSIVFITATISKEKSVEPEEEETVVPFQEEYIAIDEKIEAWIPVIKPLGRVYIAGGYLTDDSPVENSLIVTDRSIWALRVPYEGEQKVPSDMDPVEWAFLTKYDEIKEQLDKMVASLPLGQLLAVTNGVKLCSRKEISIIEWDEVIDSVRIIKADSSSYGYQIRRKKDFEKLKDSFKSISESV